MAIYSRTEVAKYLNVPEAKVPERTECSAVEINTVIHYIPDLLPSVKYVA